MKIYYQQYKQFIPADIKTVWKFFATPYNLAKITPSEMNFKTLLITGGDTMYQGQLISYKVSPLPFLRLRWTTEIKVVAHEHYFIDEQKFGPFAMWYHQHFFYQKDDGVEMVDEVCYAVPLGFLGGLANSILIKNKVRAIFQYRKQEIENIFKQSEVVVG